MRNILIPALMLGVLAGCTPANRGWGDGRPDRNEGRRAHRMLVERAADLEDLAIRVYRLAERDTGRRDRRERDVLRELRRLEYAARGYRREVERSDPWSTEREFRILASAYEDAASAVRYVDDRSFERMRRLMRELDDFYDRRDPDRRGRDGGRDGGYR